MKPIQVFETSIRDQLKSKQRETGVDDNILIKKYFTDAFLNLLSTSKYADQFIWKGGFVLTAITGIQQRTTVDLDTMFSGVTLKAPQLESVIRNNYGVH